MIERSGAESFAESDPTHGLVEAIDAMREFSGPFRKERDVSKWQDARNAACQKVADAFERLPNLEFSEKTFDLIRRLLFVRAGHFGSAESAEAMDRLDRMSETIDRQLVAHIHKTFQDAPKFIRPYATGLDLPEGEQENTIRYYHQGKDVVWYEGEGEKKKKHEGHEKHVYTILPDLTVRMEIVSPKPKIADENATPAEVKGDQFADERSEDPSKDSAE